MRLIVGSIFPRFLNRFGASPAARNPDAMDGNPRSPKFESSFPGQPVQSVQGDFQNFRNSRHFRRSAATRSRR
jgi:hypothetical protein